MTPPFLEIAGVTREFRVGTTLVRALRGVDLPLERGEIVAVVGESGSGKTTLGNLVLGIDHPTAGEVRIDGELVPRHRPRALRRRVQMVPQNPLAALNPKRTILQSVALPLRVHGLVPRAGERRRVTELLDMVGLSDAIMDRHPQVLSGGQRQRVALARAIAAQPDALVLDEPTSALDVSVQARVLELLAGLQQRLHLAYLFITHDLSVISVLSHRVVVLFRGRIVEAGPTADVLAAPRHRYTQMLIASVPVVSAAEERFKPSWPWDRETGSGDPDDGAGCRFRPRCPFAVEACRTVEPALAELSPNHAAACHNPAEAR
jgi:oligopeptide transport system ATP-binding protein